MSCARLFVKQSNLLPHLLTGCGKHRNSNSCEDDVFIHSHFGHQRHFKDDMSIVNRTFFIDLVVLLLSRVSNSTAKSIKNVLVALIELILVKA